MNSKEKMVESFRRAKSDIIQLQNQVIDLSKKQQGLMDVILETRDKESKLYQRVKDLKTNSSKKVKVVNRCVVNEYIASKTGKSFHTTNCPFAKNIKPKSKVHFKSKVGALNAGYKACDCVKKV